MHADTFMASKPQIQKINILLQEIGIMDMKDKLVMVFSDDRTTHISELSKHEATKFIRYLVYHNPDEKQRAAIIALGYKAGFYMEIRRKTKK